MRSGACSVRTKHPDFPIHGVKILKNYIQNTKQKEKHARQFRRVTFGLPSFNHKLKRVIHTCFTKMLLTVNQISKISERSSRPTFAARSWNTLRKMRSPYVTLLPLH